MSRIAYVNGRYLPHGDAAVHIEDRGYQFADGIYEVIAVKDGALIDEALHMARFERSLSELRIAPPMSRRTLELVMREVIRRNRFSNGIVYLQATRGVARRDHPFPADIRTSLVITARAARPANRKAQEEGVKVISIPDIRWARCDIKSVSLLPNVLGKQQAREAGAYEAWQVDRDGMVTEGTSTNAWIVTQDGELVTRQTGNAILNAPGVARHRPRRQSEVRRASFRPSRGESGAGGVPVEHDLDRVADRSNRRRGHRRRQAGPARPQAPCAL
jgi:D-alanine transaminase